MDTDMEMTIGDPASQMDYWEQQSYSDDCAVMAQVSLLHQFGVNITEDQAIYECASHGWYTPGGGTLPSDVGNLMDLHGISTHDVQNATIADLARELKDGHGVIVGVNSSELWDNGPLAELKQWICEVCGLDNSTFNPADHAVVVTGIDVSDPSAPQVIINDPGHPDGQGHAYPMDKFMDAWANSDFNYTATDAAIPHDEATMGDLDLLDVSKWLVGGFVGGATLAATGGDIFAATAATVEAANMVESWFADSDSVRDI